MREGQTRTKEAGGTQEPGLVAAVRRFTAMGRTQRREIAESSFPWQWDGGQAWKQEVPWRATGLVQMKWTWTERVEWRQGKK